METRRCAAVGLLLLFVLAPFGSMVQVELPESIAPARSGGAPAVDEVPTWRAGDTWVYETGFDVANLIANAGVSASVSTLEGDTTMEVASVGLMTMNDASGTSVVGYTMDIDGAFTSGNSGATLQGTSGRLDITYTGRDTVRASDMAMITSEFDLLVEFAPFNIGWLAFELADLTFTTTYDPPHTKAPAGVCRRCNASPRTSRRRPRSRAPRITSTLRISTRRARKTRPGR